ncbi:MAG: adenylate cyclase [Clostridiales bacterium]|jgi:adenylate cyclase|nr:adenylate cyclase [Clostridiales bacterium]MDN5281549.1 adenylate cyclase [Candidatus Ozemobacter sp.]
MKRNIVSLFLVLLTGLILYGLQPGPIIDIENRILDYRFHSRGPLEPDKRVVIIGLDQSSLSAVDRPFFAFAPIFAEVADVARSISAAGILFDIVFPASSEKAIKEHIASISKALDFELPHSFMRQIGFEKGFRAALLRLKQSQTGLIIGFAWERGQQYFGEKTLLRIAGAENTGYFNLPVDRDGRIRKAKLQSLQNEDSKVSSVALLGARLLASDSVNFAPDAYQNINFMGPAKTFRTISLIDFLKDAENQKQLQKELKGTLLLLGFTDITDFKATPLGYMPGVEIHANIIDNIINNRFLKKLSLGKELFWLISLVIILFVAGFFRPSYGIVFGIASGFGWLAASSLLFESIWIPAFRPAFILFLASSLEFFAYMRRIYKDRKRIKAIFGRYVSDSVLQEILSSSDHDFISGRRRELCILIADIRGFTGFSEKHEAHEVVNFLNAYFSRITEIIMNNGGVVDKFLGDGVLAFFNAPVTHENFVDNAVKSAIELCDYAKSDEFAEICGGADLKVGVAIHTGQVVFGNIGSEKKAEFTVIGDAVNACSRMESLNKEFKTSLIASDYVVKQSKMAVKWKLLGKKTLRGKQEEIDLYTVS